MPTHQALTVSTRSGDRIIDVAIADSFGTRLRGLIGRPAPAPGQALLLPRCASVHTLAMGYAFDLAYLDRRGRIVKLVAAIRPWRVSACLEAAHVLELREGSIAALGLGPGDSLQLPADLQPWPAVDATRPGDRQRGAAMIEFLVVGPALTLLGLALLQYGMLFFAKNNFNHAAFMAARAGSMGHASLAAIRTAYARALIPAFGGGRDATELATAYGKATADVGAYTRIELLNPTKESFDDWSDARLTNSVGGGRRVIPNANLAYRDPAVIKTNSGQNVQDANLIKLRITHGYEPKIPLAGTLMIFLLKWYDDGADDFQTQLYAAGRIPVVSHVTVKMESDAIEPDSPVSLPGPGNAGRPVDPGEPDTPHTAPPNCRTIGCSVVTSTTPACDPTTDPNQCRPPGCQQGDASCDPGCGTSYCCMSAP